MKELSRVKSTFRFLAYVTTMVGRTNHEKEITGREPGPIGKIFQLEYNESNIYMAMLYRQMNTFVKEVLSWRHKFGYNHVPTVT